MNNTLLTILTPIIVAILGVSGGWYKTYISRKKDREANELQRLTLEAEKEKLKIELGASLRDNTILERIGFNISLFGANEINIIVDYIFKHTKVDRFLILLACNGKYPPKFVTANFERHKTGEYMILSVGANSKYVSFEGDSYYREMLKTVETNKVQKFSLDMMPECDYKEIMITEKLKHSNVYFLRRKEVDEDNHLIAFCSTATHENTHFNKEEDLILKTQINKLTEIFKQI